MGKGKFLYIINADKKRIAVKDSAFEPYQPERDIAVSLKELSTNDLLKVKAQLATELENRMDLDEVIESNLDRLKLELGTASDIVIAQLLRQTLDRIDLVAQDEKRAKTRLEILKDEIKNRMIKSGQSEIKFNGLVSIGYKAKTVYQVGENGWVDVYNGIYKQAKELESNGQDVTEAFAILQKRLTSTVLNDLTKQGYDLPQGVESNEIHDLSIRRQK